MRDKFAIAQAAQKYVEKGQIDNAIFEWEKLIKDGSNDGNICNTIGDLHLKKGAQKEATVYFARAAEIFRADGFTPKATALYKKILNIVPSDVTALTAIGELDAEKGLSGSAKDYFDKAAQIHIRNNASEKAIELYEKMLRLSPSDMEIRLKVISLYLKMGLKARASNGYSSIATEYMEKGDIDKAHEFYTRATGVDPNNVSALIGFSKMAEKNNDLDKSLEHLAKAVALVPDNNKLHLHYAELALKAKQTGKAKVVLKKLIIAEPTDTHARRLLGNLSLNEGLLEDAWKELLPCIEESLQDKNWQEALDLLDRFTEFHPVPVRERIVNIYREQNDTENLKAALKELAHLYEENHSLEEALALYKELLEVAPDDTDTSDRVAELSQALEPPVVMEATPAHEGPGSTPRPGASGNTLSEKIAEADFYIQQDMHAEAMNIYEKILALFPDNEDILKKREALKTSKPKEGHIAGNASVSGQTSVDTREMPEAGDSAGEDYETHYSSGVDYRQQGLYDEAVREFQAASKDPGKKLLCQRMIASCYMEKGAYPLAIAEFNKLIAAMKPDDARYHDMKYELAGAYVKNMDYNTAYEIYSEIHASNADFRDISQKLEDVKFRMHKERDSGKPKKDRVSYI